jgi:hypothetical protein
VLSAKRPALKSRGCYGAVTCSHFAPHGPLCHGVRQYIKLSRD